MAIRIERGRQFAAGDAAVQLFDGKGASGEFLAKAAEKLTAQNVSVTLEKQGSPVELKTAADWKAFLAEHAPNKQATEGFAEKFGITFGDFLNTIDDVAAGDEKDLALDLRPTGALAKALSLDGMNHDYAKGLAKDATVALTGEGATARTATAAGLNVIGPEILATPVNASWDRDRTEQESWVDFKQGNGASRKFRDNTGVEPFVKLHKPTWNDEAARALGDKFFLPLFPEIDTDPAPGSTGTQYQDKNEMFRETYFDDRVGSLGKAGATVRARVRFDDDPPFTVRRVLIQAKEGRQVEGDRSAVRKFEKRFEGERTTEQQAQSLLKSGKESNGSTLAVAQKLYQLAKDKGTLPEDGNLQLEERFTVLQKRRRTHLQLEPVSTVQTRRSDLQKEIDSLTAAGQPVPEGMTSFAAKLDAQVKFMTDAGALLRKHGASFPSGETFIVSADRYNVYDPAARKEPPADLDDEVGLIGKGPLHVEAEWDTASSDPFENALEAIDKKLAAAPADAETLKAERAQLEGYREVFRKDVQATVDLLKEKLTAAGLEQEPDRKSKEQRASDLAAATDRPVFWI